MGLYDYSFNNNYLLFQNTPSTYSNFEYSAPNSTLYHDYNPVPIPSYNFNSTSSQIFNSSIRHSTTSLAGECGKSQVKSEPTAASSIVISEVNSLGKIQGIVHNTSEHVQELNQMCLTKDPKEFDKNVISELNFRLILMNFRLKLRKFLNERLL